MPSSIWDSEELQVVLDEHLEDDVALPKSKRDCERCERPPSVCLCPWLPSVPLPTAGRVVVLQHPHEQKKRLATVPVLQKCVAGVTVLRSRVYCPHLPQHAPLHEALEGAAAGRYPLLVLFPGTGARDVREVAAELHSSSSGSGSGSTKLAALSSSDCSRPSAGSTCTQSGLPAAQLAQQHAQQQAGHHQQQQQQPKQQAQQQAAQQQQVQQQPQQMLGGSGSSEHTGGGADPLYVLFVIDGTWKQAKEMYRAVLPFVLQPDGPGVRVQLPPVGAAAAQEQGEQQQQQQHDDAYASSAAAGAAPAAGQAAGDEEAADAGKLAETAEKPLLIRMEPLEGCLTTCEAVARALGALEPAGSEVRDAVLRPLAQLAEFQARYDPAVAARLATGSGYSQARCRMGMGKAGGGGGDLSKVI